MKFTKHFTASLAAFTLTASLALAQYSPYGLTPQQPNFYRSDTNAFPLVLAASAGTNYTAGTTGSLSLTLRQDVGLSMFLSVTAPNSGTNTSNGVVSVWFNVTADGTNYTTTSPIVWTQSITVPAGSTNTMVGWTNFPNTVLNNIRKVQITQLTNTCGVPITFNWFKYSYSGQ